MYELVFDVTQEADGGYVAESLGENIFTQADNWQELRDNVKEATLLYYFDGTPPDFVRLYLRRDEILTLAQPTTKRAET